MTHEELMQRAAALHENVAKILAAKAEDYAGGQDRLGNFKRRAEDVGLNATQICFTDLSKHYDAVCNILRGTGCTPTQSIEERLLDLIVYSLLLSALVSEHAGPRTVNVPPFSRY